MIIRPARNSDRQALWRILEPMIRAGETYALPPDLTEADALAYWLAPDNEVFVACGEADEDEVLGTFVLRANQRGPGAHVANCGYVTAPWASGRGVARAMCAFSLEHAKKRGFLAMQFNLVVSTNERAVRLWTDFGFDTAGRLPGAFRHPKLGLVDAYVMYRAL